MSGRDPIPRRQFAVRKLVPNYVSGRHWIVRFILQFAKVVPTISKEVHIRDIPAFSPQRLKRARIRANVGRLLREAVSGWKNRITSSAVIDGESQAWVDHKEKNCYFIPDEDCGIRIMISWRLAFGFIPVIEVSVIEVVAGDLHQL